MMLLIAQARLLARKLASAPFVSPDSKAVLSSDDVDSYITYLNKFLGMTSQILNARPKDAFNQVIGRLISDNESIIAGCNSIFTDPAASSRDGWICHKVISLRKPQVSYAAAAFRLIIEVIQHVRALEQGGHQPQARQAVREAQLDAIVQEFEWRTVLTAAEAKTLAIPGWASEKKVIHASSWLGELSWNNFDILPLAAIAAKWFHIPGTDMIPQNPIDSLENQQLTQTLTSLRAQNLLSEADNERLISGLEELKEEHEALARRVEDLVSDMRERQVPDPPGGRQNYGNTTVGGMGTAVLGDIVHNYIFQGSIHRWAEHQQNPVYNAPQPRAELEAPQRPRRKPLATPSSAPGQYTDSIRPTVELEAGTTQSQEHGEGRTEAPRAPKIQACNDSRRQESISNLSLASKRSSSSAPPSILGLFKSRSSTTTLRKKTKA